MKTLEIIGYNRANLGKKSSKDLRLDGNVPCVLYGSGKQVHFYSPMILFRDLVYTPKSHIVELNIEGDLYKCILQEVQFHPVNEIILHADFLEIKEDKPVTMEIPVAYTGAAIGIQKGGKLVTKVNKLRIKALPKDMPDSIDVDISSLDLAKSVRVGEVKVENMTILNSPAVTMATIDVPRSLRGAGK